MEHLFDSRDAASVAAAQEIGRRLAHSIARCKEATLIVSGGTSPIRCFAELSQSTLDWAKVHVTLSDERWTPAENEDSNERLVRESLLVGNAGAARFQPFYQAGTSIEDRRNSLDQALKALPRPFACALLGMGTDGHFASLFPDAENLDDALDAEADRYSVTVDTAASPHRRLSLTLSAILQSEAILLLMFGEEKRAVYERAKQGSSNFPVSHLIRHGKPALQLFWAP